MAEKIGLPLRKRREIVRKIVYDKMLKGVMKPSDKLSDAYELVGMIKKEITAVEKILMTLMKQGINKLK